MFSLVLGSKTLVLCLVLHIIIRAASVAVAVAIRGAVSVPISIVGRVSIGIISIGAAIAILIRAIAVPVVPESTIKGTMLSLEFLMEAAVLTAGVGLLVKILMQITQVLMDVRVLFGRVVRKGRWCGREQSDQREGSQKRLFQCGSHE